MAVATTPLKWQNCFLVFSALLRKCVQQCYHTIVKDNCNDPQEMWKTVNTVLNKDSASSNIPTVNFQHRVLDRPNEIAKTFNEHFVTVGPKLASSIDHKADDDPLKYLKGTDENMAKFQFTQIDTNYIKKAVMALKKFKIAWT